MKELFDAIMTAAATYAACEPDRVKIAMLRSSDGTYVANVEDDDGTASFTAMGRDPLAAFAQLARSIGDELVKRRTEIEGRARGMSNMATKLYDAAGPILGPR